MTKSISMPQALSILDNIKHKIFTVEFIKRSTNELRKMNCRKKVIRHLKNGVLNYEPIKHNLLCVFDLQSKGYRMINLNGLQSITFAGIQYTIN